MSDSPLTKRIRELMQHKGLTQKDLADLVGISQPAISLYLQGRIPPADVLFRIAQLGNISMEWLLTGKDEERVLSEVRENPPVYGNQHVLLKLWNQLPQNLQRDVLTLLRHTIERQKNEW